MSNYGLLIRNEKGEIHADSDLPVGSVIWATASFLNPNTGLVIDYSTVNNTVNVDAVYNFTTFASPLHRGFNNGESTVFNKFWGTLAGPPGPGGVPFFAIGLVGIGVGNEQAPDDYGIIDNSGQSLSILNNKARMLTVQKHVLITVSNGIISGIADTLIHQWVWEVSVNISDIDVHGKNLWVSVTPILGINFFRASTVYLYAATVFMMTASTFYIGDFLSIQSSAILVPEYPARSVTYDVMFLTEAYDT